MKKLLLHNAIKTTVCNMLRMACVALPMIVGVTNLYAGQDHEEWQVQRLLQPTAQQRASEQQGHVFIYDKLNERVIDRAMDKNFERIDSMMFINVQKKKDNSNSPTDVNTHDDDDDC